MNNRQFHPESKRSSSTGRKFPLWYWALRYLATRADSDYPVPVDYRDCVEFLNERGYIRIAGDAITVSDSGEQLIRKVYLGMQFSSAHDDYVASVRSEGYE